MSPGLAVAERLHVIAPDAAVTFACSHRPIDRMMLEHAGASFRQVTAEPFSMRPAKGLRFIRALARGTREARALLDEVEATAILSLGGFVSVPLVRAAVRLGKPVFLLNLDAVPGRANRWASSRASTVRTALPIIDPGTLGNPDLVGFPIRRVAFAPGEPASCRERLGLQPQLPTLLVIGASQGAGTLNGFMREFVGKSSGVLEGWQVLHISGEKDHDALVHTYSAAGVQAVVLPFLDQVGLAWGAAEIAISRAGANSVAESSANNVPTIFVPFPWHRDLHQRHNAAEIVRSGAGILALDAIDPSANLAAIGAPLQELILHPDTRASMRQLLESRERIDGARQVAEILSALG